MGWVPIVIRELIVVSRKGSVFRHRLQMAGVTTLVFLLGFPSLLRGGTSCFWWMGQIGFWLCVLAGANLTANAVSQERREKTLPLLFLSNLTGWDVVIGKLASGSLQAFMNLIAVFPVLALTLMFGGVTLSQVITEIGIWMAALWFSLSLGLWVSCWSRWTRKRGEALTTVELAILFGIPWGMIFFQNPTMLTVGDVQWAFIQQLGAGGGFGGSLAKIWKGIAGIFGGTIGILALAGFHLQQNWRNHQEETLTARGKNLSQTSSRPRRRKSPKNFRSPFVWLEQTFSFSSTRVRVTVLLAVLLLGAWTVLAVIPGMKGLHLMHHTQADVWTIFLTLLEPGFGIRLLALFLAPIGIKELMQTGLLQLFGTMPGGLMQWWQGRKRAFRRFYNAMIIPVLFCALVAWSTYTNGFSAPFALNLRIGGYILGWTIALFCDLDAIHALQVINTLQGKRSGSLHTFGLIFVLPWCLKIFLLPLFAVPLMGFLGSWLLHMGNALFWMNRIALLEEDALRLRLLARA